MTEFNRPGDGHKAGNAAPSYDPLSSPGQIFHVIEELDPTLSYLPVYVSPYTLWVHRYLRPYSPFAYVFWAKYSLI